MAARELLVLCILAALGGTEAQLTSHAVGNLKAGNSQSTQIAALIHCLPYVGFPRALNAIRAAHAAHDSTDSRPLLNTPDESGRQGKA